MKHVDITKPCSEDWNKMTPTEKGAFCKKCSLEVQDFTNMDSTQIRQVLVQNMGQRVCGHIKPSQIDRLNDDFEFWKMNSSRSMRRAMLYAFLVVFGLTLFSCEEDDQPDFNKLREIGISMIDETKNNFEESLLTVEIEPLELELADKIEPVTCDINKEEIVMLGQMVSHLEMVEDIRREVAYNGGIGYSEHYAEYLIEETPDAIYVEKTQENIIRQKDLPKPLVFPNPAVERITMKYSLAKTTSLDIRLLSMTGELVRNLNSGEVEAGEHELAIDLIDLKSGVYLVTIHSEELQQTVRFVKR